MAPKAKCFRALGTMRPPCCPLSNLLERQLELAYSTKGRVTVLFSSLTLVATDNIFRALHQYCYASVR